MKIVHIISGMRKAAGTSVFCGEVCNELSRIGNDVAIVCHNASSQNNYQVDSCVKLIDFPFFLNSLPSFKSPGTIFHLHGLWSLDLHKVSVWAYKNGVSVVWSTHGMTAPWSMHHKWWKKIPAWLLYQKRDLLHAAAIHSTVEEEMKWNVKLLGGQSLEFRVQSPESRVQSLEFRVQSSKVGSENDTGNCDVKGVRHFIAPLGTKLPEVVPAYEHCADRAFTILFVGRIYPVKGLVNLVKAAAIIKQSTLSSNKRCGKHIENPQPSTLNSQPSTPNSQLSTLNFRIVGPDQAGHLAELQKLAEELDVDDMFEWCGAKYGSELTDEYVNCDVLILPSFTENFGATVVDAMAYSKPVITSRFTPWNEVAGSGPNDRCGWWVDNSPESLAATILETMHLSHSELAAMGVRGRKLVEDKFTWTAVAQYVLKAYYSVVSD